MLNDKLYDAEDEEKGREDQPYCCRWKEFKMYMNVYFSMNPVKNVNIIQMGETYLNVTSEF